MLHAVVGSLVASKTFGPPLQVIADVLCRAAYRCKLHVAPRDSLLAVRPSERPSRKICLAGRRATGRLVTWIRLPINGLPATQGMALRPRGV